MKHNSQNNFLTISDSASLFSLNDSTNSATSPLTYHPQYLTFLHSHYDFLLVDLIYMSCQKERVLLY